MPKERSLAPGADGCSSELKRKIVDACDAKGDDSLLTLSLGSICSDVPAAAGAGARRDVCLPATPTPRPVNVVSALSVDNLPPPPVFAQLGLGGSVIHGNGDSGADVFMAPGVLTANKLLPPLSLFPPLPHFPSSGGNGAFAVPVHGDSNNNTNNAAPPMLARGMTPARTPLKRIAPAASATPPPPKKRPRAKASAAAAASRHAITNSNADQPPPPAGNGGDVLHHGVGGAAPSSALTVTAAGTTTSQLPPFPWAKKDRVAAHYSLAELAERGIHTVEGEVQCKRCDARTLLALDVDAKFRELHEFIARNVQTMDDRAPEEWKDPALPDCDRCGQKNSLRPVIPPEKERINWVFLLLGQTLGLCTLEQLKHFCAHTNQHRTGAKDRVLYSTYMELCNQLHPGGPFDMAFERKNRSRPFA
ncbi:hypothetical protein EJB05_36580, partial [Eragrostis curvula]